MFSRIIWERALGLVLMSASFAVMCMLIGAACVALMIVSELGA